MQRFIRTLAQIALIVSVSGFLLALISSGEVGFKNNFGFWVGMAGLVILGAALIVGLVLEGFRRLSDRRVDAGRRTDSDVAKR